MLTKNDLLEIKKEIKSEVDPLRKDLQVLKSDVTEIKKDVEGLKSDVTDIKKDVEGLKSDVTEIKKDVKVLISFFDRQHVTLRKRVDKIEDHLGLTSH